MTNKHAYVRHSAIGCPLNPNNAQRICDYLELNGWTLVDDPEKADLIVASGCAFHEGAEKVALAELKELHRIAKKSDREVQMIAAGCLPHITNRTKGKWKDESFSDIHSGCVACSKPDMHLLDEAIGAETPFNSVPFPFRVQKLDMKFASQAMHGRFATTFILPLLKPFLRMISKGELKPDLAYRLLSAGYALIVPGQGCQNRCSYCCINFAKTDPVSLPSETVVKRIKEALSDGAAGVMIFPDDLGSWGKDLGFSWTKLIDDINSIEGNFQIALYHINANQFVTETDAVERMLKTGRLRYMGIMVQHVNPEILKRMHRMSFDVDAMVEKLKVFLRAGVEIQTHVIVGFPGETEEQFAELESFFQKLKSYPLDAIFFPYSRREGTYAAIHLKDQELPHRIINKRIKRIRETCKALWT